MVNCPFVTVTASLAVVFIAVRDFRTYSASGVTVSVTLSPALQEVALAVTLPLVALVVTVYF